MSNAPNETPEDFVDRYELQSAQQKGYLRKQVAYLCVALRFFGVETVTAAFDAYGDEGSIEKSVYEPPLRAELPFGLVEEVDTMWISFRTTGWGINPPPNGGLDGTLTLDVAKGEVVETFFERRPEEWERAVE